MTRTGEHGAYAAAANVGGCESSSGGEGSDEPSQRRKHNMMLSVNRPAWERMARESGELVLHVACKASQHGSKPEHGTDAALVREPTAAGVIASSPKNELKGKCSRASTFELLVLCRSHVCNAMQESNAACATRRKHEIRSQ